MKPKVFIAKPIPKQIESYIAEHCVYRKWEKQEPIPRSQLLEEINNVEGLLTTGGSIDRELLEHAPKLKVVSNITVGYNNFDIDAMKQRQVMGTHTPYVLDESVADLTFGLMLAVSRRITELDQFVKAGKWQKGSDEPLYGVDVHSTTLGIIGMGRIGKAVARRAMAGFNMDVCYHNRNRRPDVEAELGVRYASLHNLLQESDFAVLLTPLTSETHHLIGKDELGLMKKTAIFINVSRGPVVDEQALIDALQNQEIYGAGLDVFDDEPVNDSDYPLLNLPNVVTLPHIGSATAKTRFNMAMLAAKNLVMAVNGAQPPNVVPELSGANE